MHILHMKHFFLILTLSLLFFACKRKGEPFPRICTESANTVGDVVTMKLTDTLVLVNCSEHYTKQRWVMPDGGSSVNPTVYFIPSGLDTVIVRLFVSNDDFLNEFEATKRVAVIP